MSSLLNKIRIPGLLIIIVALGISCAGSEQEYKNEKLIDIQQLSGQWILHKAKGDILQVPLFNPKSTACVMQFDDDQVHIWDLRDERFKEYYLKGSWKVAGDSLNFELIGGDDVSILLRKLSATELLGIMIVHSTDQKKSGKVLFRKMKEPTLAI